MHIEKNICDNILGTLLIIEHKSKDNPSAREDLKMMGLRPELHPQHLAGSNKILLPAACFSMDKNEKNLFCKVLHNIKVPDGYSSNISRRVKIKECKILALKSHDCHVLMQQLLPLAIRKALPKTVSSIIIELCGFFRELCMKVCREQDLRRLQDRIGLTLCHLEQIFPPAFFDVMVHLPIHLASECMLGGPVQYRWMYPIERFLYTLKSYVRNRSQPEGSIAEGYLADECLSFCSRYLAEGVETRFNRLERNYDGSDDIGESIFSKNGRPLGKVEAFRLSEIEKIQAHRYVLFNSNGITSFLDEHVQEIRMLHPSRMNRRQIERIHNEQFSSWLEKSVPEMINDGRAISEEVISLSKGPRSIAKRYKRYIINGFKFHIRDWEKGVKTQNSGVVVTAKTSSYASSRNQNPIHGDIDYYGVLKDIIELQYSEQQKIVLFKCDWVDVRIEGRWKKVDELKFPLVNLSRLFNSGDRLTDEPYVLACQVQQVFYVQDPIEPKWYVVVKTKPRDLFDMGEHMDEANDSYWDNEPFSNQNLEENVEMGDNGLSLVRTDMPGTIINASHLETNIDGDNN